VSSFGFGEGLIFMVGGRGVKQLLRKDFFGSGVSVELSRYMWRGGVLSVFPERGLVRVNRDFVLRYRNDSVMLGFLAVRGRECLARRGVRVVYVKDIK